MYFPDLIDDGSKREQYLKTLHQFSQLVHDAVEFLLRTLAIAEERARGKQKLHHAPIWSLTRHASESIDGVSVLAAQGCTPPCKPLLRSAFEAAMGVQYILEADEERRGLAYIVAHAHRRLSLYKRLDAKTAAGQQLASELARDPTGQGISPRMQPDSRRDAAIANLESMLASPDYAAIQAEWINHKKPKWYGLFGGPKDICSLAKRLNHVAMYEFIYRDWSDNVHAGDGMLMYGRQQGESCNVRPLRHPDGLQSSVTMTVAFSSMVGRALIQRFGTKDDRLGYISEYKAIIHDRQYELLSRQIITANWR